MWYLKYSTLHLASMKIQGVGETAAYLLMVFQYNKLQIAKYYDLL